MKPAHAFLAAAASCLTATAQSTWIVDATGSGHFTDLPPAIAAAAQGDRIVVLGSGTYSALVLGKGLDIEAIAGASVPRIDVAGVTATARARVAGFRVPIQPGVAQIVVQNCTGGVALVELQQTGPNFQTTIGQPALVIADCARVLVDRGLYAGQPGTTIGGEGMRLSNARAVVIGATIRGGVDVSTFPSSGNDGMAGMLLQNGSHALLCGADVAGGSASQGNIVGGDGGDGLVTDATSAAIVLDASRLHGLPGGWGSMYPGQPGEAAVGNVRYTLDCTIVGPTAATPVPSRPVLTMPAAVAIGTSLTTTVRGEPGQWVWLAFDFVHDYAPYPALDGALVLTPNGILAGGVLLDALGTANWGVTVPNAAYARHVDVHVQGLASVAGAPVLTGADVARTF